MSIIIKNGQKVTYSSNDIDRISSFSPGLDGSPSKGKTAHRAATKFSVLDETQNIYIILEGQDYDLDIYITPAQLTRTIDDGLYISRSIASSTEFDNRIESVFARLKPGDYYLDIRANEVGYFFENQTINDNDIVYDLTFDSLSFDSEFAKLPNDTLLNQQWHLFNGGLLSLFDNPEFKPEISFNENVDGILPNTDIIAPEAWKINHSAKDIVVAVIDDGIDIDHPDLANNIWTNSKEINGTKGDDDDNNQFTDDKYGWNFGTNSPNPKPYDPSFNHGTHVAGTIGAEGDNDIGVSGVAWDVQLMALNISDPVTGGLIAEPEKALEYAANNGADIANMSFGSSLKINPADLILYTKSDGSSTQDAPVKYKKYLNRFYQIFTNLENADVLAVIAAGNDGSVNSKVSENWNQIGNIDNSLSAWNYMATFFNNAMNISASDGMMNLSPYTNTGLTIDLAAPGGNQANGTELGILSTYPMGGAEISEQGFTILEGDYGAVDYGYMQGTSMAAPVVSGAAALVKATNPSLSASDIRDILIYSAVNNPKLESLAGENGLQLNLKRALEVAQGWTDPRDLFDFQKGSKQDDVLLSGSESAWYRGRKGDDVIVGNHGDDRLYGNKGDDIITPGKGFDIVKGGKGQDTIIFNQSDESPIARPDRVFLKADDRIDLSAIDGDGGEYSKPGNQSLRLIETATFNGIPGELLARRNGVFADLDGDAYADFGILFDKPLNFDLTSDHFIL